jgi:hypothetical protein
MNMTDFVVIGADETLAIGLGYLFFGPRPTAEAALTGGVQEVRVTVKGGFRLFITHLARYKAPSSRLRVWQKDRDPFGRAAFLSHPKAGGARTPGGQRRLPGPGSGGTSPLPAAADWRGVVLSQELGSPGRCRTRCPRDRP